MQRDQDVNLNTACGDDEINVKGDCLKTGANNTNITVHLNKTNHTATALNITKNHTKNNISTEYEKKIADLKKSGANVTIVCPNASNSSNSTNTTSEV